MSEDSSSSVMPRATTPIWRCVWRGVHRHREWRRGGACVALFVAGLGAGVKRSTSRTCECVGRCVTRVAYGQGQGEVCTHSHAAQCECAGVSDVWRCERDGGRQQQPRRRGGLHWPWAQARRPVSDCADWWTHRDLPSRRGGRLPFILSVVLSRSRCAHGSVSGVSLC